MNDGIAAPCRPVISTQSIESIPGRGGDSIFSVLLTDAEITCSFFACFWFNAPFLTTFSNYMNTEPMNVYEYRAYECLLEKNLTYLKACCSSSVSLNTAFHSLHSQDWETRPCKVAHSLFIVMAQLKEKERKVSFCAYFKLSGLPKLQKYRKTLT